MLITKPQPHLQPREYFGVPREEVQAVIGDERAPVWAVHTKPRAEKKLARFCEMAGVGHYLPTMLRKHTYPNRSVRTSWLPVFPGYLFVLQESFDKVALLRSNAVVQFMRVPRPEELYADLQNLWMTLVARPSAVAEDQFQPGVRVEVISGAMKGVIGEVLEPRKGGVRLMIKVHMFERAVSVEVDMARLRRI